MNYQTSNFQDFVITTRMKDLQQFGYHYTWSNGSLCKLDRAMINKNQLEDNDRSVVEFRPPGCLSNHTPCIVSLLQGRSQNKNSLKFNNMKITHMKFHPLFTRGWEKADQII